MVIRQGSHVRTVGDTELQARFLNEMIEANEKKRKLEAALAALDTQYQLLIESAARKDIQVYKESPADADVASPKMMTTQTNLKQKVKQ